MYSFGRVNFHLKIVLSQDQPSQNTFRMNFQTLYARHQLWREQKQKRAEQKMPKQCVFILRIPSANCTRPLSEKKRTSFNWYFVFLLHRTHFDYVVLCLFIIRKCHNLTTICQIFALQNDITTASIKKNIMMNSSNLTMINFNTEKKSLRDAST